MTLWITPDNKFYDDADGDALSFPAWPLTAVKATQSQIDTIQNASNPKLFQPLSRWQVRKVLTHFGLRTQVENAIAASTDQGTKDAWAYANDFARDNVLLNTMGAALGMTSTQLDNLFTVGITL